jgi:pyruvate dehydrogenase E1 component alpha subunit
VTYRLSDHTTADDARRYRPDDEVKQAWEREPLKRLRKYLEALGHWDEAKEQAWKEQCGREVDLEVNAYLETRSQPIEAIFDFLYAELPHDLREQRAQAIALEGRTHG